jgi:hypothetical protein
MVVVSQFAWLVVVSCCKRLLCHGERRLEVLGPNDASVGVNASLCGCEVSLRAWFGSRLSCAGVCAGMRCG